MEGSLVDDDDFIEAASQLGGVPIVSPPAARPEPDRTAQKLWQHAQELVQEQAQHSQRHLTTAVTQIGHLESVLGKLTDTRPLQEAQRLLQGLQGPAVPRQAASVSKRRASSTSVELNPNVKAKKCKLQPPQDKAARKSQSKSQFKSAASAPTDPMPAMSTGAPASHQQRSASLEVQGDIVAPRKRGRPLGSKNAPKKVMPDTSASRPFKAHANGKVVASTVHASNNPEPDAVPFLSALTDPISSKAVTKENATAKHPPPQTTTSTAVPASPVLEYPERQNGNVNVQPEQAVADSAEIVTIEPAHISQSKCVKTSMEPKKRGRPPGKKQNLHLARDKVSPTVPIVDASQEASRETEPAVPVQQAQSSSQSTEDALAVSALTSSPDFDPESQISTRRDQESTQELVGSSGEVASDGINPTVQELPMSMEDGMVNLQSQMTVTGTATPAASQATTLPMPEAVPTAQTHVQDCLHVDDSSQTTKTVVSQSQTSPAARKTVQDWSSDSQDRSVRGDVDSVSSPIASFSHKPENARLPSIEPSGGPIAATPAADAAESSEDDFVPSHRLQQCETDNADPLVAPAQPQFNPAALPKPVLSAEEKLQAKKERARARRQSYLQSAQKAQQLAVLVTSGLSQASPTPMAISGRSNVR